MRFIDEAVYWGIQYRTYLSNHADRLPPGVIAFAFNDWYYNPQDHRCPHDSWLEELAIIGPANGERNEQRGIEISLRLLGAYHDGNIFFRYPALHRYRFETSGEWRLPPLHVGHGDFSVDEIRLQSDGFVEYEIAFSRGSRFLIECSDIEFGFKGKK